MNDINEPDNNDIDFFIQKNKQYEKGKYIVRIIVIVSFAQISFNLITSIFDHKVGIVSIGSFVLWCFIFFKLYEGNSWAKWWYIVGSGVTCALSIILLAGIINVKNLLYGMTPFSLWYPIVCSAIDFVSSCILLLSKNVYEFLYCPLDND